MILFKLINLITAFTALAINNMDLTNIFPHTFDNVTFVPETHKTTKKNIQLKTNESHLYLMDFLIFIVIHRQKFCQISRDIKNIYGVRGGDRESGGEGGERE